MGEALSRLFSSNAKAFVKTDLEKFSSFSDWFLHIRLPWDAEQGHYYHEPLFFLNELEIYALAFLTFLYAYRHGSRYVFLWLAILMHGFT